jgi:hypothetical protein
LAAGLAGVVAHPGGHGGGAVVAPHLGGVVVADGGDEFGIEPVGQRERFGEHKTVDGQVEVVDRIGEGFEDAADLPGHDR